jgi:hypothetical protein
VNLQRHIAALSREEGNGSAVYRKEIEFTNFLLSEVELYFTTMLSCCRASIDRRGMAFRRAACSNLKPIDISDDRKFNWRIA